MSRNSASSSSESAPPRLFWDNNTALDVFLARALRTSAELLSDADCGADFGGEAGANGGGVGDMDIEREELLDDDAGDGTLAPERVDDGVDGTDAGIFGLGVARPKSSALCSINTLRRRSTIPFIKCDA